MLILLPISTHEHQNHLCLTWKASVSINWERRFPRPASPRPWWTGSTHKRSRNCISIKFIPKSVFSNQFSPRVCTTWPQQNSGLLIGGCFGPPGAWRVTGGQRQVVPWEGSGLAVAASPKSSCLCGAPRLVESQSWPLDYHWLVLAGLSTLFRLSTPLLRGMQARSSKMNIAPVFNNSF